MHCIGAFPPPLLFYTEETVRLLPQHAGRLGRPGQRNRQPHRLVEFDVLLHACRLTSSTNSQVRDPLLISSL